MTPATQHQPWTERQLTTPLLRLLHTTPLKVLCHAGQRYLVSLHGNSDWVRNLRVHPHARLRLGRHRQHVTAVELPEERRAPVLDAYLAATRLRTTRQLLADTGTHAQDHPVFQL